MHELIIITVICGFIAAISWLIPEKWRGRFIVLSTIAFLLLKAPISLIILSLSTISSYWIFRVLPSSGMATILIVIQNIGYFLLYKSGVVPSIAQPMDRFIPLGLSYYAFRQIHYALEYYKGKLPKHTFEDYVSYLFFLPTILSGPIHRFEPFLRDIYRKRWNADLFSLGLERILYGYGKILILGNLLISNYLHDFTTNLDPSYVWLTTYLSTLEYTLSAYFIFAGFSDVAIGLSLLMGFKIIENFNYPFLAPNINEFWNRWHISLSSWLRDYVFSPITSITRQPLLGILMTMLLIGLWHEISWRYIIWGLFHGLGIAFWHLYKDSSIAKRLNSFRIYHYFSILLTFHFVLISFVFIREDGWNAILQTLKTLFLIA